ncbi:MAG: DUF2491 family protein [Syntrophobacter sp.]
MGVIAKIVAKQSKQAYGRVKDFFSGTPAKEQPKQYQLGLRLNAVLRFEPTDFILAGDNLKLEVPDSDLTVMAVGEFRCMGVNFCRFYAKDLDDREWVLQVGGEGDDREIILYQTLDEIFPDDWDLWLNDSTGLIGYKDFNTPDQVEYARVFYNPGPDYANPIEFRETIGSGGSTFYIDQAMMLYGRNISIPGGREMPEYLLVTREEDEEGALVRIMTGVPLNAMSFTVL